MEGIEGEEFCYKMENDRVGRVLSILAVSNRFGWAERVSSLLWGAFTLRLQGFIVVLMKNLFMMTQLDQKYGKFILEGVKRHTGVIV